MSATTTIRGRPKGSGIDDQRSLRSIAELIEQKPGIRPTTAIRQLGVNDPSEIRRLRDKYRAVSAELMAEIRQTKRKESAAAKQRADQRAAVAPNPPTPEPGAIVLKEPSESVAQPEKPAKPAGATLPAWRGPADAAPLVGAMYASFAATWYGMAFNAAGTAAQLQSDMLRRWATWPPTSLAMRQQLALSAFVLSACTVQRRAVALAA